MCCSESEVKIGAIKRYFAMLGWGNYMWKEGLHLGWGKSNLQVVFNLLVGGGGIISGRKSFIWGVGKFT